jgi:hypothetical protein
MRHLLTCLFVLFSAQFQLSFGQNTSSGRCANPEIYKNHPALPFSSGGKEFEKWMSIAEELESEKGVQDNDEIYYIPVVVHVLHNGEAIGTGRNLSVERVQSQINILNNDFGRIEGTPGFNTNPAGADSKVRFCLATIGPNGEATNGIVRINTNREGFDFNTDNVLLKGFSIWDVNKYLNIWTCQLLGNQYIGYAQYPIIPPFWADSLNMIQPIPDVQPDGVVIDFRVFGDVPVGQSGPFPSYNKGRTCTHEIGHYLGLLHIWGDGFGCSDINATDFCNDTPKQGTFTSGCPASVVSCTPPVLAMKENFMDYTNDICMNVFTNDQKKRMRIVLRNCIRRKTLLTTLGSCGVSDSQPVVSVTKEVRFYSKNQDLSLGEYVLEAPDELLFTEIRLFDVAGKEYRVTVQPDTFQTLIKADVLPKGAYFLKIKTSDGKTWNKRFATW